MDKYRKDFLGISRMLSTRGYLTDPGDIVMKHGDYFIGFNTTGSPEKWDDHAVVTWNIQGEEPALPWLQLFKDIFKVKKDYILGFFSKSPFTLGFSKTQKDLSPLLDDLAQLAGPGIRCTTRDNILKYIKKREMLLVKGEGCLCLAKDFFELQAMAMVVEKACRAEIESFYIGGGKKISFIEAWLMRCIYKVQYSKKYSQNVKKNHKRNRL
jgi:hypothetical protein